MSRKNNFSKIIIVWVLLTLILLSPIFPGLRKSMRQSALLPFKMLSSTGKKIHNLFSAVGGISDLRKENEDLVNKITQLEVDRAKINELENENKVLKKELGFAEESQVDQLIPAKIIGREPVTFLDYIIVDQGKRNGVVEGAPVISNGVLVGRVREVFDNQSKIVLITSKDSIIQAMLQNSRAKGVLSGGVYGLTLSDISQDANFMPGENIVTSGLGGGIKEGILIGKAKESKDSGSGIFKEISVESSIDMSKLEMVFIVKT